jgi:hypothetical protein
VGIEILIQDTFLADGQNSGNLKGRRRGELK